MAKGVKLVVTMGWVAGAERDPSDACAGQICEAPAHDPGRPGLGWWRQVSPRHAPAPATQRTLAARSLCSYFSAAYPMVNERRSSIVHQPLSICAMIPQLSLEVLKEKPLTAEDTEGRRESPAIPCAS